MDRTEDLTRQILPYSAIQGQLPTKRALEIAFVAPRLGGVLLSGERGTGKSTVVRAFSCMMFDDLPVTLPINATEDRVVGGWNVAKAIQGEKEWQDGLLHAAGQKDANGDGGGRFLYVDEVNLLDDHIVNILLDVTSTGFLDIEREGISRRDHLELTLVGTMNPEEGGLRPQLLDRFALMVPVQSEEEHRLAVLQTVTEFDRILDDLDRGTTPEILQGWLESDRKRRQELEDARRRSPSLPDGILEKCVALATEIGVDGHRGERVLALAAQAHAAIDGAEEVQVDHLRAVAPMSLQHRQAGMADRRHDQWNDHHQGILDRVLNG